VGDLEERVEEEDEFVIMVVSLKQIQTGGGE
jgi:hypothetical protein